MQLLIEVSAGYAAPGAVPPAVRRGQYEIARRLLADEALHALPIVTWNDGLYAIERARVVDIFAEPEPEARVPEPAQRRASPMLAWAGRHIIDLVPPRARPEARQSLLHASGAVTAMLHPPQAEPHASPVLETRPALDRLSTVVHPTHTHVVLTCAANVDWAPLRQLAEVKQSKGFRVVSLFHGDCVGEDVIVARAIDVLDASDVIVCISSEVRRELERLAADTDRPTPTTQVVAIDDNSSWEQVAAQIRSILCAVEMHD